MPINRLRACSIHRSHHVALERRGGGEGGHIQDSGPVWVVLRKSRSGRRIAVPISSSRNISSISDILVAGIYSTTYLVRNTSIINKYISYGSSTYERRVLLLLIILRSCPRTYKITFALYRAPVCTSICSYDMLCLYCCCLLRSDLDVLVYTVVPHYYVLSPKEKERGMHIGAFLLSSAPCVQQQRNATPTGGPAVGSGGHGERGVGWARRG